MTELDDCRGRAPKNNDTNKWYHVLAKDATRLDLNFEEGKLYLASVQNFPQNPILRIVCAPLAQSQSHLTWAVHSEIHVLSFAWESTYNDNSTLLEKITAAMIVL